MRVVCIHLYATVHKRTAQMRGNAEPVKSPIPVWEDTRDTMQLRCLDGGRCCHADERPIGRRRLHLAFYGSPLGLAPRGPANLCHYLRPVALIPAPSLQLDPAWSTGCHVPAHRAAKAVPTEAPARYGVPGGDPIGHGPCVHSHALPCGRALATPDTTIDAVMDTIRAFDPSFVCVFLITTKHRACHRKTPPTARASTRRNRLPQSTRTAIPHGSQALEP